MFTLRWCFYAGTILLVNTSGLAQKCPPITARNQREAVQMEASSNKIGCWQRDGQGNLVFTSATSTPNRYKPLPPLPQEPKLALPARIAATGLVGRWAGLVETDEADTGRVEIDVQSMGGGSYSFRMKSENEGDKDAWSFSGRAIAETKDTANFSIQRPGECSSSTVELQFSAGAMKGRFHQSGTSCPGGRLSGYRIK